VIIILGSGISGLFAAWACLLRGKDFIIYTINGKKPYVMPCTYLHYNCEIPFLGKAILHQHCLPKLEDERELSRMYSKKVYGDENASNNFASKGLRPTHSIWNMRQAVDFIWNAVQDKMEYKKIVDFSDINKLSEDSSSVISTIPLDQLDEHGKYNYKIRWITEFSSESSEDYCIFNVSDNTSWYRMGNVFGRSFIESLDQLKPDSYSVKKLGDWNATAGSFFFSNTKILFTGRYGRWNQKLLAHDVFFEVMKKLDCENQ
jgi:hypothetical protein